jgi:hypothetical protein
MWQKLCMTVIGKGKKIIKILADFTLQIKFMTAPLQLFAETLL